MAEKNESSVLTHATALAKHYRQLIENDVPQELAGDLTKIAATNLDGLLVDGVMQR